MTRRELWASCASAAAVLPPPAFSAAHPLAALSAALSTAHAMTLLAVVLAMAEAACGAFEDPWPDARTAGLAALGRPGGTWIAAADDSVRWSAELSAWELFGLPEVRGWRALLSRAGRVGIAVELSAFGSPVYQERVLGLGVSRRVERGSLVDLRVRALGLSARGVEDEWSAVVDAGVSATLLERLSAHCRFLNVGGASIRGSPVASHCVLGASMAIDRLVLVTSALLETGFEPGATLGVEFDVTRVLTLRAGTGTRPGLFAAGIGVSVPARPLGARKLVVDAACQWHPELGVSSFATISLFQ